MKKMFVSGLSIAVLALLWAIILPCAQAQQLRERGLRTRVGATQEELASGQAERVQLWAVIIGVSVYKFGDQDTEAGRISNLKNAADDAQAVYDFLKSPEGGAFRDEKEGGHMVLLKDEQATKENAERALAGLKRAGPNDYFVIYISSHGALIQSKDPTSGTTVEIPYFLLYDSDLRNSQSTMLKMETFRRTVSEIAPKKGLVLSDTCHSGGVQLAGRDTSNSSIRANDRYIEEMNKVAAGVGYISAADQLEQALERDDLSLGVFTYCLLRGLSGNGDTNSDGKVTFNEITAYLREEVPKITDNRQNPKYNTTAIEANRLPLSVVSYADEAEERDPGSYGLLVIRTPDVDGVDVAIDGKPFARFEAGTQRSVMARVGVRDLSFTRGEMRRTMRTAVESGRPKMVEVNLTFSESYEDALEEPSEQLVGVSLREEAGIAEGAKDLFTRGVDRFNKQKFEEAVELLTRAIEASGGAYADALVYRGRAEQSLGRKEAAVGSFRAALQLRPTDFETQTLLAEAKFNAGYNLAEVEMELRSIIRRHPSFPYARVVYGDLLLSREEVGAAEVQLRKAITIDPKSPPAHLILADALTAQDSAEKRKRAVEEARKALQLFEELSRKQVSAARGLRRLSISHVIFGGGRYVNQSAMAEAQQILAKVLARTVERDEMIPDRESCLEEARASIEKAIGLAQKSGDRRRLVLALGTSAEIYLLRQDAARAIEEAQKSLVASETIPDLKGYYEAHYTLYSAYASIGKNQKAADHLEKYLEQYGSRLEPGERQALEGEVKRLKGLKRGA